MEITYQTYLGKKKKNLNVLFWDFRMTSLVLIVLDTPKQTFWNKHKTLKVQQIIVMHNILVLTC